MRLTSPIALFISALLVLSAGTPGASAEAGWSQTVGQASLARAHQDNAAAETLLLSARKLAREPYEKFETARLLGRFYQKVSKYTEAEAELKQCLAMGKTYDYLRGNGIEEDLSELYVRMGRSADAHEMVELSSQADRADARVRGLLEPVVIQVQKSIKKSWRPPMRSASTTAAADPPGPGSSRRTKRTICRWLIAQSGEISCLHISQSSGDEDFDRAALAAVKTLSPFPALPKGSPHFVEIRFSFDYNLL